MFNRRLVFAAVLLAATIPVVIYPVRVTADEHHETAYERVIRTGVLRCAYGLWEPSLMRDPNTGQVSGIVYDIMQDVGRALHVKVEYVLEVPWDSISSALKTGKADAHCAGVFATPARGRSLAFSDPVYFSPTVAFARIDDNRFDNHLERINSPDVTAALSDDDITTEIYNDDFPLAKKTELPQTAPPEELFLLLASKKADVTFNSPAHLRTYEKGHPGQIKIIPTAQPLRIFPNVIAVDIHEQELLHMINTAIDQEVENGGVEKIIAKYGTKYDDSFLVPVNRPYTWKK